MTISSSVFDNAINRWTDDIDKPWNRLKYELARANLERHWPPGQLRILDAGGGTGRESIPLAEDGHRIDLVDYSAAMLIVARQNMVAAHVESQVTLHQADVTHVAELFDANVFDVVLCHNVLQYVNDIPALLQNLAKLLKPGGVLSLISKNRCSSAWWAAFYRDNLEEALQMLDNPVEKAVLFDTDSTNYSGDEIAAMLPQANLVFEHYYGIRCIWDYWRDNEKRASAVDQLWKLEFALTNRQPYNLLARFWQIIAHKL
jgi:S-adenosylmethionine-dependent methyltransferase